MTLYRILEPHELIRSGDRAVGEHNFVFSATSGWPWLKGKTAADFVYGHGCNSSMQSIIREVRPVEDYPEYRWLDKGERHSTPIPWLPAYAYHQYDEEELEDSHKFEIPDDYPNCNGNGHAVLILDTLLWSPKKKWEAPKMETIKGAMCATCETDLTNLGEPCPVCGGTYLMIAPIKPIDFVQLTNEEARKLAEEMSCPPKERRDVFISIQTVPSKEKLQARLDDMRCQRDEVSAEVRSLRRQLLTQLEENARLLREVKALRGMDEQLNGPQVHVQIQHEDFV